MSFEKDKLLQNMKKSLLVPHREFLARELVFFKETVLVLAVEPARCSGL